MGDERRARASREGRAALTDEEKVRERAELENEREEDVDELAEAFASSMLMASREGDVRPVVARAWAAAEAFQAFREVRGRYLAEKQKERRRALKDGKPLAEVLGTFIAVSLQPEAAAAPAAAETGAAS